MAVDKINGRSPYFLITTTPTPTPVPVPTPTPIPTPTPTPVPVPTGTPTPTPTPTPVPVPTPVPTPTPTPIPTPTPTPVPVPTPTTNYFYLKYCDTGADVFCGGVQQTLSDNTGTWSIGNSFYNTCVSACTYLSTTAPLGSVSGNIDGSTVTRYNSCAGCFPPTPTPVPVPTAPVSVWYQMTDCADSSTKYSQQYIEGQFSINDRVTAPGGVTLVITGWLYANPGGTLYAVSSTGLTGCPTPTPIPTPTPTPPVSVWYQMTDCSDSSTIYSQQYNEGTFAINDRVTSLGGLTAVITGELLADPGGFLYAITATGQTGCP